MYLVQSLTVLSHILIHTSAYSFLVLFLLIIQKFALSWECRTKDLLVYGVPHSFANVTDVEVLHLNTSIHLDDSAAL